MLEPDVALTDFLLAAECAAMSTWLYWRAANAPLRTWFVVFFAVTGFGALLGGIVHGFLPDTDSLFNRVIWVVTLLAIGIAASSIWLIGSIILFARRRARQMLIAVIALFAVYALAAGLTEAFVIAVIYYVPAAIFLLAAFVVAYRRDRRGALLAGIAGVALSLAAAIIQVMELAALGLSHNALYHLVQAVALLLIFIAALDLTRSHDMRAVGP